MPFTGRSAATIRDSLLSNWQSRYNALALQLDTSEFSPSWLFASALAVELEGLEAQAEQLQTQVLPDQAAGEFLDRHGFVHGVTRDPATSAVVNVTITGANGVYNYTANTLGLTSATGLIYRPSGVNITTFTIAAGTATIRVTCTTTGASTTPANGAILTWQAAPAGVNPTGTVVVPYPVIAGADAEPDADYAQRIIDRLRERPASGNRADWRAWVQDYTGVSDAYVYTLLQAPAIYPGAGTGGILGCVTVLAVGPAQGDSPTNTRIFGAIAGAELQEIREFINGEMDANGVAVLNGTQLRPVTMVEADFSIEAIQVAPQNVDMSLVLSPSASFPWTGTMTVNAASDATHLVVDGDFSPTGTDRSNTNALINVGVALIRGAYQEITLNTGVYAGGPNTTTWTFAAGFMLGTPTGLVYPAPTNWSEIRTEVFELFDRLAPGDTADPSRWPYEGETTTATLYRAKLTAAIVATYDANGSLAAGVAGVLSITVNTPAADVSPAGKTVVTLGTLLVHA